MVPNTTKIPASPVLGQLRRFAFIISASARGQSSDHFYADQMPLSGAGQSESGTILVAIVSSRRSGWGNEQG